MCSKQKTNKTTTPAIRPTKKRKTKENKTRQINKWRLTKNISAAIRTRSSPQKKSTRHSLLASIIPPPPPPPKNHHHPYIAHHHHRQVPDKNIKLVYHEFIFRGQNRDPSQKRAPPPPAHPTHVRSQKHL